MTHYLYFDTNYWNSTNNLPQGVKLEGVTV